MAATLATACSGSDGRSDMVHIQDGDQDFWIDQYEFPNKKGRKPTVYVNLDTAAQGCASEGKRLCTAAEWRRACTGGDPANRYGYGPAYKREVCHSAQRLESGHTSMMKPQELIAASGAFEGCTSPDGVVDLVGNAEEWVLDDWQGNPAMLEGGAWYTYSKYADCSGRYSRQADYRLDPSREVFSAGFRCCWSEAAPTAADLTPADLKKDALAQLDTESAKADTPYDPVPEVEIRPGFFIDKYEYPNQPGALARTAVSWNEAGALCAEAGKRLCSATEWELSCAGDLHPLKARPFPYGKRHNQDACPALQDAATPIGAAADCVTPEGVADLAGGVWEWTSTPFRAAALSGDAELDWREIRGGSWYVDASKGICQPYDGYPTAPPDGAWSDVGFRCCRGELNLPPSAPELDDHPCPEGMVAQHGFCIDQVEAPGPIGTVPRNDLSLADAKALCAERNLRVCSEGEWMLACMGSEGRRWPYGQVFSPQTCRDGAHAAAEAAGGPQAGGSHPDCVTPEGVFDMSGNSWEWTVRSDGSAVLHGGSWNLSAGLLQCRAFARASPTANGPGFATRCCVTADEASALLSGN